MQRCLAFLLLLFLAAPGFSMDPQEAATVTPAPYPEHPEGLPLPPVIQVKGPPHIALILPLKSTDFARAADMTRQGFLAAARIQGPKTLPVRIYETGDDVGEVFEQYRSAVEGGAQIVVGPLTRSGVSALASRGELWVPTLALNAPEGSEIMSRNLFVLSLQAESEARQVAAMAATAGRGRAIVIYADTPLGRRMDQAFSDEWRSRGGFLEERRPFRGDPEGMAELQRALSGRLDSVAFFAMDSARARLLKPFADPALPVFATSQVNPGSSDRLVLFDLGGIRFADMPWLLQPDHAAVMIYPRLDPSPGQEMERLYALGIDAFRAAEAMRKDLRPGIKVDGVTGKLTLGADRYFARVLTQAQFREGEIIIEETVAR